jgi:hypothetical protein
MRILFERTGGFAGRKVEGILDCSALPLAQAHQLSELLRKSRFFDLPTALKVPDPGADRFLYKITVENENGLHTVEASDASVPGEMRPLLDYLTRSLLKK